MPQNPAREFYRDLKAAGIPKKTMAGKIDFRGLRTSYVSLCIESGASVKEAQSLARHSDPRITMNAYARARDERLSEITEKVAEKVLSGVEYVPSMHKRGDNVTSRNAKPRFCKSLARWQNTGDGGNRTQVIVEQELNRSSTETAQSLAPVSFAGETGDKTMTSEGHLNDNSEQVEHVPSMHGADTDPRLSLIVDSWPRLPEGVRSAIAEIARASGGKAADRTPNEGSGSGRAGPDLPQDGSVQASGRQARP